jgi:hypothetical protein
VIELTKSVAVNPPDATVKLGRDDVWLGLMWKAEEPMPFVPSITECTIVSRDDTGFVRDIVDFGEPIRERVTLVPKRYVVFERMSGRVRGTIRNEIEDTDGELRLRFTFALDLEGAEAGGPEERALRDGMGSGYLGAVESTLAAVRERLLVQR